MDARRILRLLSIVAFSLPILWVSCAGGPSPRALQPTKTTFPSPEVPAEQIVYGDALAAGWNDWSWNTATNLSNTTPVHSGAASIAVSYAPSGWGGLQLVNNGALDLSGYDTLRFWIHGGASGGQTIQMQVRGQYAWATQAITLPANTWLQVNVPLQDLGQPASVSGLVWWNPTGGAQPTFYVDDIAFIASGTPAPPSASVDGPALSVDAALGRHPISPDIYGMNYADEALAAELKLPVRRWGGNATTLYNWQNDTYNTGSDWYFENIPADNPDPSQLPDGSSADRFVEQDRRTNTRTLLTVPLIGWTPKRRPSGHPYDCGFRVSVYGAQQSVDPWDSDCGNGVRADGTVITGNDPHDTSMPITPAFVQDWIRHLTGKYGLAANGGVLFYNLDNEPMLWNSTHRDVHPQPTSYDEIRERTIAYASAIKAVDPGAKTLGPAVWGWVAYQYSALDVAAGGQWWDLRPDRRKHGDTPFLEWYLQQMRAYEEQTGTRILDYLDVHFYPQAEGVYSDQAGDAGVQARRLRSTRALWDPNYVDESWIGEPVDLIPRLRAWVDENYPGTRLAISEYSWGAMGHISGALAEADVLGIFGREGLDLATLWGPPTADQPGAYAFRMYRNYDGQGSAFGDVSVQAASADPDRVAVYAAQRSSDGALTVMVINKTTNAVAAPLTISSTTSATAQVYQYGRDHLDRIVHLPDQTLSGGRMALSLPAYSITLLVFPATDGEPQQVYLPWETR